MYIALKSSGILCSAIVLGLVFSVAQASCADGAFVTQATKSAGAIQPLMLGTPLVRSLPTFVPPHAGTTQPTPETTVPATGGNWAGTLETGRNNSVLQAQSGSHNVSDVGILGGTRDNVDVLQHGQGLVSNVWLLNMQGTSVDVLQPPGSAPVNMLIARLPNGALLIKR